MVFDDGRSGELSAGGLLYGLHLDYYVGVEGLVQEGLSVGPADNPRTDGHGSRVEGLGEDGGVVEVARPVR